MNEPHRRGGLARAGLTQGPDGRGRPGAGVL